MEKYCKMTIFWVWQNHYKHDHTAVEVISMEPPQGRATHWSIMNKRGIYSVLPMLSNYCYYWIQERANHCPQLCVYRWIHQPLLDSPYSWFHSLAEFTGSQNKDMNMMKVFVVERGEVDTYESREIRRESNEWSECTLYMENFAKDHI